MRASISLGPTNIRDKAAYKINGYIRKKKNDKKEIGSGNLF